MEFLNKIKDYIKSEKGQDKIKKAKKIAKETSQIIEDKSKETFETIKRKKNEYDAKKNAPIVENTAKDVVENTVKDVVENTAKDVVEDTVKDVVEDTAKNK